MGLVTCRAVPKAAASFPHDLTSNGRECATAVTYYTITY